MVLLCLVLISTTMQAQQTILPMAQFSESALVATRATPVSIMQNGKELALASARTGSIFIVDATTGQLQYEMTSMGLAIKTLKFLPDDQTLLGADDSRVCLWDMQAKRIAAYCPPLDVNPRADRLVDFALSPDGLSLVTLCRSNAQDNTPAMLQGWKLPGGELAWSKELPARGWMAECKLSLSVGGKRLAMYPKPTGATKDKVTNIRLWNIVPDPAGAMMVNETEQTLVIKGLDIRCVTFHPNGKELVLAGREPWVKPQPPVGPPERELNGLLLVYRLDSLQEIRRFETELINAMSCLEFNRTGNLLAGCDIQGLDQIAVWETTNWKLVAQAKRSYQRWLPWPDIKDIRFTDLNQLQCAVIINGMACQWLLKPQQPGYPTDPPLPDVKNFRSHSQNITSLAFSSDDKLLYSFDEESSLCTWDTKTLLLKKRENIAYPDKIFLVRRGGLMPTLKWSILRPTLSSDGTWLVRNGMGVHLVLTNVQSGEHRKLQLEIVEQPQLNITLHAGFSPDGSILVAGWIDRKRFVRAWETKTGKVLWTNTSLMAVSTTPVFSPDSKKVIVSGVILETASGELVKPIDGMGAQARTFYSPDGRQLVSQDFSSVHFFHADSAIEQSRWKLPHGNRQLKLLNYPQNPRSILVSVWQNVPPDGPTSQVQFIELASMQPRLIYSVSRQRPLGLFATSHDGTKMVASDTSVGIYFWNLFPHALKGDGSLTAVEIKEHWQTLRELPAQPAWQSMSVLISHPAITIHFMGENLKPRSFERRASELIDDLNHKVFARREQAEKELLSMGKGIEPFLREAAQSNLLEQSRRAKKLLEALPEFDLHQIRNIRAVEVLERIGSKDAKALIERLAKGPEDDPLAKEARQSIQRFSELKK